MRRAWLWHEHPFKGENLQRVAFHEAGHVVLFEWLGATDIEARATASAGLTHVPQLQTPVQNVAEPSGEQLPILACTAAAAYHAGTCAELLAAGERWNGPVFRPHQLDHRLAEMMLAPVFGAHASCAHGYAQRLALHVLSHSWPRVCEVAQILTRGGTYHGR